MADFRRRFTPPSWTSLLLFEKVGLRFLKIFKLEVYTVARSDSIRDQSLAEISIGTNTVVPVIFIAAETPPAPTFFSTSHFCFAIVEAT